MAGKRRAEASVNGALRQRLAGTYKSVPRILEEVSAFLGNTTIPSEEECEVYGFFAWAGEQVFTLWMVSDAGFSIFEMLPTQDFLSVHVPLSRVRRYTLGQSGDNLNLVVEIDADNASFNTTGETVQGPTEGSDVLLSGRSISQGVITFTRYEKVSAVSQEQDDLRFFMRGLSKALIARG